MTPAFPYLFEIGLVQQLWTFSEPYMFVVLYPIILAGFGIQYKLLQKVTHRVGRWGFAIGLALAVLGCEVGFNLAGGWDRLGVIVVYCGVFCLVLGCIPATVVYYFKKKAG
ncbi:MAG: hypothetical protein IKC09_07695 [Oscillospiraceae bacterium]|nr:hypothetical protein [Oscillospiraceae bacterium]